MMKAMSPELGDVLIVHGAPGAGKGTMSDSLARERSHARHISAGDTIRDIFEGRTESPHLEAMRLLAQQGILFPGDLSTDIMLDAIRAQDGGSLFLFDGFPQRKTELDALLSHAQQGEVRIMGAICLEVDAAVSIERMERRGLREGEIIPAGVDIFTYYRTRYERFMEYYATIKAQIAQTMRLVELDANKDQEAVYVEFSSIADDLALQ